MDHCESGRDVGARTDEDLVAWADTSDANRELERRGATAHRDCVSASDKIRELSLELA